MSITNSEEANQYYKLVNQLVDEYVEGHKIRPSKLSAYLKPGGQRFNKFLERNKLKDIVGADRILRDVIEDREHMEKDGVITFESFKIYESSEWKIPNLRECIYKGIDKADIKMEKVLADYFDINLGAIDVVDTDKHKFSVEDWKNDDWKIVIYSEEELQVIKENIVEYLYDEVCKKEIDLSENIKLKLSDLIEETKFTSQTEEILNNQKVCEIITNCLGDDWSFEAKTKDYYIWVS